MRNVQTARKKERQTVVSPVTSSPIPPLRSTRSISHLGASVIWIKYASAVPSCHQPLHLLHLGAGHGAGAGAGMFWTAWVIKVNYIFHGSHQFFVFPLPYIFFIYHALWASPFFFIIIIIYIWGVLGLCRFFHSINLPVDLCAGDGQPAGFSLFAFGICLYGNQSKQCAACGIIVM